MEEIVYFELNNWFTGRDYPPCEPIASWVHEYRFNKDEWCKENKLCVLAGNIDMSQNWCITAPIGWVKENFPQLLSEERYTYTVMAYRYGNPPEEQNFEKAYSDFRRLPDEDGEVLGQFDWRFLDYEEDNFGVRWCNEDGSMDEDEYEEDGEG